MRFKRIFQNDTAYNIKAVTEEEIEAGLADGTAVEIDVAEIANEMIEEWYEKLEAAGLDDEYNEFINEDRATEAAYAEEAKCGVNATEEGTCWFCTEVLTREAEGTALNHSFVDYTYNGDATCTANGTKTAECAHCCGETDTVEAEDRKLIKAIYTVA